MQAARERRGADAAKGGGGKAAAAAAEDAAEPAAASWAKWLEPNELEARLAALRLDSQAAAQVFSSERGASVAVAWEPV